MSYSKQAVRADVSAVAVTVMNFTLKQSGSGWQ
jgi:hypothetical protein